MYNCETVPKCCTGLEAKGISMDSVQCVETSWGYNNYPVKCAKACVFPTNYSNCPDFGNMPGCTTCDGDSNAWCFVTLGANQGWRYCHSSENVCSFPFTWKGNTYKNCTQ